MRRIRIITTTLIAIATTLVLFSQLALPVLAEGDDRNLDVDLFGDERCSDARFAEQNPGLCDNDIGAIQIPIFTSFEYIENFSIFYSSFLMRDFDVKCYFVKMDSNTQ